MASTIVDRAHTNAPAHKGLASWIEKPCIGMWTSIRIGHKQSGRDNSRSPGMVFSLRSNACR